jgi:hypothetical protein
MKSLFLALALSLAVTTTASAQTLDVQTSFSLETDPPQLPTNTPLASPVVAQYLLLVVGSDPIVVDNVILRSELLYGAYFTIDQALALLPAKE